MSATRPAVLLVLLGLGLAGAPARAAAQPQAQTPVQTPPQNPPPTPAQTPPSLLSSPATPHSKAETDLLVKANVAMQKSKWDDAAGLVKRIIAMDPRWEFYQVLASAQFNQGRYQDALASDVAGVKAAESDKVSPPASTRVAINLMLTQQALSHLKLKHYDDAIAAFEAAVRHSDDAAGARFMICVTYFTLADPGSAVAGVAACDKAIALDPARADAYFMKASLLYSTGSLNRENRFQVPAGTVEALNEYLKLAPTGPHAQDVKGMLASVR